MNVLLDSSFPIDLLNELASGRLGPAGQWLRRNRRARLWVIAVSVAEVLEGADDMDFVRRFLARFGWQGLHHAHAARVALLQMHGRLQSSWRCAGGWLVMTRGLLPVWAGCMTITVRQEPERTTSATWTTVSCSLLAVHQRLTRFVRR